jgi:hypothetical protein
MLVVAEVAARVAVVRIVKEGPGHSETSIIYYCAQGNLCIGPCTETESDSVDITTATCLNAVHLRPDLSSAFYPQVYFLRFVTSVSFILCLSHIPPIQRREEKRGEQSRVKRGEEKRGIKTG